MIRENLNDLLAFMTVARERNFTRAAAQLGMSQSALSRTIKGLEARMGLALLTRTTRSVALTEAGRRVFAAIAPRFEEIDVELETLSELRDQPAARCALPPPTTPPTPMSGHACAPCCGNIPICVWS